MSTNEPPPDSWSVERTLTSAVDRFRSAPGSLVVRALLPLIAIALVVLPATFVLPGLGEAGLGGRAATCAVVALLVFVVTVLGAPLVLAVSQAGGEAARSTPWAQVCLVGLIVGLACGIGAALWLVPALIAAIGLYFWPITTVLDDVNAGDALRATLAAWRTHPGPMFIWPVLALTITFAGGCLCLVGFLVAYPIAIIGGVATWRNVSR